MAVRICSEIMERLRDARRFGSLAALGCPIEQLGRLPRFYRREVSFRDAASASLRLSGQPIRHWLPPIEDQFLPAVEVSCEIGERPLLRGNDALDLSDGLGAFQRICLAAEAVNFEATKVRHHVLKAEMRQPAELQ